MLRTSRCFVGTLLQLGGPDALQGVERYPYPFHCADFSFARIAIYSLKKFIVIARANAAVRATTRNVICKLRTNLLATAKRTILFATAKRLTAHNLGGNLATQLVAIG
jgi:hypothetical protein